MKFWAWTSWLNSIIYKKRLNQNPMNKQNSEYTAYLNFIQSLNQMLTDFNISQLNYPKN